MLVFSLTFSHHIQNVTAKSQQISGYILRTFKSRDPEIMLTLYKSLVQPHLDYCVQLWYPHKVQDMQKLESVQRSFTARINNVSHLDYWERLSKLNLFSVQRRYERYIIIYVWKVLENLIVAPESENIVPSHSDRTGRMCKKFQLPQSNCTRFKTLQHNSLSWFGVRIFNVLPRYIRDFTGSPADSFKKLLDKFLHTIGDEPNIPGYKSMLAPISNSIIDQLIYIKSTN